MKKTLLFLFVFVAFYAKAQTSCGSALPFCAGGVSGVSFPATTGTTVGETGPDYTCLGSEPNPAWYYMQISTSGTLDILIAGQTASGGPGFDVDFTCWGPFTSLSGPCGNLDSANTVDCSYSSSYTETLNINNAVVGQYYMVLITNFSNQPQNIIFTQIGGNGGTNCSLVGNNTEICAGGSATIIANNSSHLTNPTYSLIPGGLSNTTGTFIVTPQVTTNYTLFITGTGNNSTLTQTAVSTVTVNTQPLSAATTTQTSCTSTVNAINLGLTFNPGGGNTSYTVNWTAPAPNGVTSGTQTLISGGINPGTYTAVITADGGCQATSIVTITPIPAPSVFSVSPPGGSYTVTCAQPTIVLSGSIPTYIYNWNNGIVAPMTGVTTSFVTTSIGHWTVTGTDPASTCSSTHVFTISVNTTAPTSSVSPVSQVINCGAGIVATATGVAISPTTNVTHMWYSPAAPTNPVSSGGQTSIFTPIVGTNTFVLVDNVNGCSTAKTLTVTSTLSFPTFSLLSSQNYSIGCTSRSLTNVQITNANADSGAVVSYTILPPNYAGGITYSTSTSINVFTITTPGTYTVIVRDNNNHCETRVPVAIIQNTFAPDIQVSTLTRTLSCFTPSIMLLGSSANASISTVTYTWSYQNGVNPGNVLSSSLAVNVNTAVPSNTLINTYTLAVYDQNNACSNTSVVPLYQNTSPPHAAIGVQNNIITCTTPSINLTNASASGVPVPPFTNFQAQRGLYWKGPTPQLPDSNKSTYAAFTPGTYTMTTQDLNNGCTAVTTTLILDGRIYPIIQTNTLVPLDCDVANTGGVKLAVTIQSLSAGQVSVAWSLPQPPPNVNNVGTLTLTTDGVGLYKVTVTTNTNGCSREIGIRVTPGALTASFTPDKETGFAPLTVNFTNSSSSTSTVNGTASVTSVWSFGNGTSRTTTTNINTSAVYTAPGTYSVTMFTSKGACRDTLVKVITVDIPSKLVVPNVFTPNGDNSNDLFFVQAANLTSISAQIFDRWGNKIYDITSATGNIAWDGKNQSGHEAPDGTYFYTIKATGKDGATYDTKGTVSLYR